MDSTLIELLSERSYAILVPLLYVLGPLLTMLAGLLIRVGELNFIPTYAVIVATFLAGDVAWYWIGYHYGEGFMRRFGRYVSITPDRIRKTQKIFHTHHDKILFISKITNGLGFAIMVLFTAGLSRVPFWRYVALNVAGELIWSGMLLAIGYYLGHVYTEVEGVITRVSIAGFIALLFLIFLGAGRYVRVHVLRW